MERNNIEQLAQKHIQSFLSECGCATQEEQKQAAKQLLASSIHCFECIDAGLTERLSS